MADSVVAPPALAGPVGAKKEPEPDGASAAGMEGAASDPAMGAVEYTASHQRRPSERSAGGGGARLAADLKSVQGPSRWLPVSARWATLKTKSWRWRMTASEGSSESRDATTAVAEAMSGTPCDTPAGGDQSRPGAKASTIARARPSCSAGESATPKTEADRPKASLMAISRPRCVRAARYPGGASV